MANRLTYLEIPTDDQHRSASFYAGVLGWSIEERDDGTFRFQDEAAHLIGRWVSERASTREPGILPFLYVDHVADAAARAASSGGEVLVAPYREGDVSAARLRDPAGNVIGIWQLTGA